MGRSGIGKLDDPATDLNAVTSTGAGSGVAVDGRPFTVEIIASSVTTGGTMKVQGTIDGSNWFDMATVTVSADGNTGVSVTDPVSDARTNLTARTDGTYTTKIAVVTQ